MNSSEPSTPAGSQLLTSAEGMVLHWTNDAEQWLGFSNGEVCGQSFHELVIPHECQPLHLRRMRQAIADGAVIYENVLRRRDGMTFWAELRAERLGDQGSEKVTLSWQIQDTTQLRLLRESKLIRDRFRDLLQVIPGALMLVNATGQVVYANRSTETMLGYAKGRLSGMPLQDLVSSDHDLSVICLQIAASDREASETLAQKHTVSARRADGSGFLSQLTLNVFDAAEGVFWLAFLSEETVVETQVTTSLSKPSTDHLEHEIREAILQSAVAQTSADHPSFGLRQRPLLLIVDDEECNRQILNMHLGASFEVREASNGADALLLAVQERPDIILTDIMMPIKNGLELCRDLRASEITRETPVIMLTAMADQGMKLDCLAAGASDFISKPFSIAELSLRLRNFAEMRRQKMELAAQKSQIEAALKDIQEKDTLLVRQEKLASLGRMSAGLIHEINNPLNYALQGLHILKQSARQLPSAAAADFSEVLRDVEEGVNRVARIIADLRGFTRTTHQSQLLITEIQPIVQTALRFFSHAWKAGVELRLDVPLGLKIRADVSQLVQVITNLVKNALDAMRIKDYAQGEPQRLMIQGCCQNSRIRLSVRDNGPGMTEEIRSRIFDPFFTTKDVGKGMGLGLSICHSIIAEHNATIDVHSVPGEFTEFVLEFPSPESNNPG